MLTMGRVRRLCAAVAAGFFAVAAPAAAAETLFGTTGTQIVRFNSASPGTIEQTLTVTGLQPAETVVGIDIRPATGQLMAMGSTGRLYRINSGTGAATSISTGATPLTGSRFGMDFNPSVDRLRLVSDQEQNLRFNPLDGSLMAADQPLLPAGEAVSSAYDQNTPGTATTTLFALDAGSDKLVRIGGVNGSPSPNLGAVTEIGAVGVNFANTAGFDVAPSDGTAYASLTVGPTTSLYTVNLSSGAATKLSDMPAGIVDIAVAQPRYSFFWSISSGQQLVRSHSDNVSVGPTDALPLSGLNVGEIILALDQRPATGDLVALTSEQRIVLIDPASGAVAPIGTALTPAPGTMLVGFDFNPAADRIRLVGDNEKNLRLDPTTGAIAGSDTPLNPAGEVTAAAYTNSFPGATTTVLYDLDSASDTLLRQNPPNDGVLTSVGVLQSTAVGTPTVDINPISGFDIAPAGGFGFLMTQEGGGNAKLFRVNLAEGAVTGGRIVQVIDTTVGLPSTGLAVMSPGAFSVGSTSTGESAAVAKVVVVRAGGRTGPVTVEYTTADGTASAGQDYTPASGVLRFADGETAKVLDIPVTNDASVEAPETLTLTLSKPGGGAVLVAPAATVSLISDDVTPAGPPAGPPTPVPDRIKPLTFLSPNVKQTIRGVRSRGLKFKLVVGEAASTTTTATITAAAARTLKLKSRTIGTVRSTYTRGAVKSLTLRLLAKAKSGLGKSKKPVAVTLTTKATDRAKNVTTTRASLVLALK